MALPPNFDWKNPPYASIFRDRMVVLKRLREHPQMLASMKVHYRENPADLIDDWGVTYDPRLVEKGLPGIIPFLLFPRQRELIDEIVRKWRDGRPLLVEKSRDCGASWVAISLSCCLCLSYEGMRIGFGSRKEEYVDRVAEPKSLFWKARAFMENLPPEFRGGWESWRDAPHMRISFPETGSQIGGEAGDNIGRGDRTGISFIDEAAHLERPKLIDAALSLTTRCRIDMSSVNGMGNPFAEKRHGGRIEVFVFDWRDDPRKDDAWYEQQQNDLDPVIVAQEIDRDYTASVEGIVIPGAWIRAAIDAHIKIGIQPTGAKFVTLDVADEGPDKNAACGAHGVVVEYLDEWSGKGSDTFATVQRAFDACDEYGATILRYDSDGIGALVRGDARVLNEGRLEAGRKMITTEGFRGSEAVFRPDSEDVKGRKNKDYFANRKAQAWWSLRTRFQKTHRWVAEHVECDPDEIISISSEAKDYLKLVAELSQPTYATNKAGKIVIDKNPDGVKSPNRADAVMMRFSSISRALVVPEGVLQRARQPGTNRLGIFGGRIPRRRSFRLS